MTHWGGRRTWPWEWPDSGWAWRAAWRCRGAEAGLGVPRAEPPQLAPDPSRRAGSGAPSSRTSHALNLFAGLPSHYDALGAVMSFGQDPRWRRALVQAVAPSTGQRILDVATGTGLVARALLEASGCTVVGLDQSPPMLARARDVVARSPGLAGRMSFVQ